MPRSRWNHSIMARGTAEPPHRNARIEEVSTSGCSIRYCWMPPHTVGTPAEKVTFSSENSRTKPGAERSGPG